MSLATQISGSSFELHALQISLNVPPSGWGMSGASWQILSMPPSSDLICAAISRIFGLGVVSVIMVLLTGKQKKIQLFFFFRLRRIVILHEAGNESGYAQFFVVFREAGFAVALKGPSVFMYSFRGIFACFFHATFLRLELIA